MSPCVTFRSCKNRTAERTWTAIETMSWVEKFRATGESSPVASLRLSTPSKLAALLHASDPAAAAAAASPSPAIDDDPPATGGRAGSCGLKPVRQEIRNLTREDRMEENKNRHERFKIKIELERRQSEKYFKKCQRLLI
jgi:hypothetical protein